MSNHICNTIYKLLFWDLNDFHFQYPQNTSHVSAVMCQSEEAQVIIKSQKILLEQGNS